MNDEATEHRSSVWGMFSVVFLRLLLPAYILIGAVTKLLFAGPGDLPSLIQTWLLSTTIERDLRPPVLAVVITVELAAAFAMILLPRFAKIAGGLILTAFIFVLVSQISFLMKQHTLMEAMFDGSCGCFGEAVAIPPGVMLVLDALLLVLVIVTSSRRTAPHRVRTGPLVAFVALVVCGAALAFQGPLIKPKRPMSQEMLAENVLRPSLWIGKRFEETPLARLVDIDPTMLGGGKQHWIFYRKSCPVCHSLFEEKYANAELPSGLTAVVAIHVPPAPNAPSIKQEEVLCPTCEFLELDPGTEWIVTTPGTVIIEDGVIVDYIDGQLKGFNVSGDEI